MMRHAERSISNRTILCGLLVLASWRPVAAGGAEPARPITIHRVIGPETKTGDYKHPASFTELNNGDLYLAYYGGAGEYADETKVFGMRLPAGQAKWTAPVVIASQPFLSLGNPVVWQAPDGLVWLFYVIRFGDTWSTSRIGGKISRDGGQTWSDSFLVTLDEGTMVRCHPIVLRNGDYLLPIYHETGNDPEVTGADSTSRFLRKSPGSHQWVLSGVVQSDRGNLQPAIVQVSDSRLIAFCRRAGDYLPTTRGWIVRSESNDGGFTWDRGTDTEFPNPNSAVELKRLANGHLLLVYNDSMSDRTPLTVAISQDDGGSFPHRRNLIEGPGSFAYPTAVQTSDGRIHVIFTSDDRTVIRHAVLEESQILADKTATPNG
jgi:predicted neuraminidase